jgi:hypothetical protein
VQHFGRQEFQRHGSMEPCVFGLIDNSHYHRRRASQGCGSARYSVR